MNNKLIKLNYFFYFLLILLFNLFYSKEIISSSSNYLIFYPFRSTTKFHSSLLAPPHIWIRNYEQRIDNLFSLVELENIIKNKTIYSRKLYLKTLYQYIVGDTISDLELSVEAKVSYTGRLKAYQLDQKQREAGQDWSLFALTMTGRIRVKTIQLLLEEIIQNNIKGDIIETGVWRGGTSIFMRGVLDAYQQHQRKSYVCDSFSGLPPSEYKADADIKWDHSPYLEISVDQVTENFITAGIYSQNIIFVKGFFSNTMPQLATMTTTFSLLRLDGDMYESTVDVLYHLYDKLSIGGYVFIDDWSILPTQRACLDFMKVHNFKPQVITPDPVAGYWKKTQQIKIQYWRYKEKKFSD